MALTSRKRYRGPVRPANWQVSDSYQISQRRTLDPSMEFKVTGRRGVWFHFIAHVVNPDAEAEWIDATDERGFHSFHPSRITETRKITRR